MYFNFILEIEYSFVIDIPCEGQDGFQTFYDSLGISLRLNAFDSLINQIKNVLLSQLNKNPNYIKTHL